jgi:predicted DNA-binding transcriptional regulator AlpA
MSLEHSPAREIGASVRTGRRDRHREKASPPEPDPCLAQMSDEDILKILTHRLAGGIDQIDIGHRAAHRHRRRPTPDIPADNPPAKANRAPSLAWDEILPTPAAARFLGLSESTLEKMRLYGTGPPFIKLGPKAVGYDRNVLDAYKKARTRRSTSDTGGESQT